MLEALAPNAILLTHGDVDTGVLGYLRLVEQVRPDVEIYNDQGLVFGNRLFDPVHANRRGVERIAEFIRKTERPIYHIVDVRHGFATEDYGLFRKVRKDQPGAARVFSLPPRLLGFFERLVARDPSPDAWTIDHRNRLLAAIGRVLYARMLAGPPPERRVQVLYERVMQTFPGRLARLEAAIELRPPGLTAERVVDLADTSEAMLDDRVSTEAHGRLYYLKGTRSRAPAESTPRSNSSVDRWRSTRDRTTDRS